MTTKDSTLGATPERATKKMRWLVPLVVLPVAVAIAFVARGRGAKEPVAEASAQAAEAPVQVTTMRVQMARVPVVQRLPGNIRGEREARLAANTSGMVAKTLVEPGDQVKRRQALIRLDVSDARLSAKQARAEAERNRVAAEQAKIECDRFTQLRNSGAVSDLEYQQRMTECRTLPLATEAASARAKLASKTVSDGVIRAPFAGIVAERLVEVGEYVRADTAVVRLVSGNKLELRFAVPEADIAHVKMDDKVAFSVAAYPKREFTSSVRFISGAINQSTRDLSITAVVDDAEGLLKSGMFADVSLKTGTKELPVLPRDAVVERDGRYYAFFLVNGRIEERIVAVSASTGDQLGVLKGASAGDQLIVSKRDDLKNGQAALSAGGKG